MVEPVGSQFLACWLWSRRKRMNLMPTAPSLDTQSASSQSPVFDVLSVVFRVFLTTSNYPKIIYPRLVHLRGVTIATFVCLSVEFYGVHRNITFSIVLLLSRQRSFWTTEWRRRERRREHTINSGLCVFVQPLILHCLSLSVWIEKGDEGGNLSLVFV